MGKNKLRKFADMKQIGFVYEYPFARLEAEGFPLRGKWGDEVFGNSNPITLELGCGKGEYTVGLARRFPERNFIGIDIKGARMWSGATQAQREGLANVAFLRTSIELLDSFFAPGEVDQIWITFPDPQMNKRRVAKRLTAPGFLERYARFLKPEGTIHLKTDSGHLHEYTKAVLAANGMAPTVCCNDIYGPQGIADAALAIKTAYETRFLAEGLPITYLQWSPGGRREFAVPDFPADELLVGENTPVR